MSENTIRDALYQAGASRLSRGHFLKAGAVAGAGLAALASPLGAQGVALARRSERLARQPLNPLDSVSLRFMVRAGPGYVAFFKKAGENFSKKYPNVSITYEDIEHDFQTKLKVEMAGGNPPDLAFGQDDQMFSFAARGTLTDLAPFFKQAGLKNSDFWPAAINPQYLGPHLFAMPLDYGLHGMWYNKSLFDKQHMSYPTDKWTWNDFVQVGRHLTVDRSGKRASDAGFDPNHVVQYGEGGNLSYWFNYVLRSNGGEWASSDLKKALLDTPVAVKTFQFIADLGNKYFVSVSPKYPISADYSDLTQNNLAMHFDGTWQISYYPHYPLLKWEQGNIDFAPFPLGSKGRAVGAEASGLIIPKGVKDSNVPWAWQFIKYMATEEGQRVAFSYGVASIPNSRKLAEELVPSLKLPRHSKLIMELLPQAKLPYWCEAISDNDLENILTNPFSPAPELLDMYKGRKTAAQAMPITNKRVQALLDADQTTAKQFGASLHL